MRLFILNEDSLVKGKRIDLTSLEEVTQHIKKYLWSPICFKGNYRSSSGFLSSDFLVLDIDKGLEIQEAQTRLKGLSYIIAPTRSHRIPKKNSSPCDRFRLIVPLSKPINNAEEYKKILRSFKEQYIPEADDNALDAARFFYPSPHTAIINKGRLYIQTRTALPVEVVDFLAAPPKEGQGFNSALYKASFSLFKLQFEIQEVKQILSSVITTNGWTDYNENDVNTIKSAEKAAIKEAQEKEAAIPWWTRYLLESELIIDASDNTNYFIYNKKTHSKKKIDKATIINKLGKKEGIEFIKSGQHVFFGYRPLDTNVLLTGPEGEPIFNTYNPPQWLFSWYYKGQPVENQEIPTLYKELFTFLMADHQESFTYLLDWMSKGLRAQNLTYLCAVATQGAGKNVLGDILKELFGETNSVKVTHQVFKSHFNAALKDKRLVFVDEINLTDDEAVDRLKDMVNNKITIEAKGKDSEVVHNYANIYLATNRLEGIPLEAGDRRFSVLNFTDTPLIKNPALLERIKNNEHTDPDNIASLGAYLWNRVITNDMLVPFKSVKTAQVIEARFKSWERYVLHLLKASPGEPISFDELRSEINKKFNFLNPPGDNKLIDLARRCPDVVECKGESLIGRKGERLPTV